MEGSILPIEAIVKPDNATDKSVVWNSSDPDIAIATSDGKLYALKPGNALISATTNDGSGLTASVIVTVTKKMISVESLTLDPTEIILYPNDEQTIQATVLPENATYRKLEWESENESVATVDSEGKVTAISPGTVAIICRTTDGSNIQTACTVHVENPIVLIEKFEFDYPKDELIEGEMMSLTPKIHPDNATNKEIEWYSSNEDIIIINEQATVTAIKPGEAKIGGRTTDGSSLFSEISVKVMEDSGVDFIISDGIEVKVENGEIVIKADNAEENMTELYSIDGHLLYKGTDSRIKNARNGIYILRIAGKTLKITI